MFKINTSVAFEKLVSSFVRGFTIDRSIKTNKDLTKSHSILTSNLLFIYLIETYFKL